MGEKITESSWKAFVKKQKLDVELADKDLLKALANVDKTDERKPEPRIAALKDLLKEIPKQVIGLSKQKKELGDKPFGLLKGELNEMLEEAEAQQKKAQAALDAQDEEPDDEDSAASALVNPKQLLKQLTMCRKDPDRRMKFAFVDAKGKDQPAMLAMHPRMSPRALFGKLQAAAGVKTGAYGTAWVADTSLMLQLDKPMGGLVKKVRPAVKASGFRITKAVLWNEDGSVFEQDELPEDAEGAETETEAEDVPLGDPNVPRAPGKPSETYEAKLATLQARVKKAADEGSADAVKHQRLMEFAQGKAKGEDFLGAMAALKQVEQLLDHPAPKAEPGSLDAGLAFKARMGALIPKIKDAATAAHAGAADARLKASEAGAFAAKGDFTRAQALLDEVEGLLEGKLAPTTKPTGTGGTDGGKKPEPLDDRNLVEKWNAVRLELQPRVDQAVAARGEQAGKISTAWALALESAGKGDFPKAEIIAQKLRDILPKDVGTPVEGPQEKGKPEGSTANVDAKTVLLQGRQEVSRLRALITAFGATCPPAWLVELDKAEKTVEDSASGTLTEIEEAFVVASKVLKDLEPLVTELTAKKLEFEKKAQALEDKSKQLALLDAIKNCDPLKNRHAALQVDLDSAREEGKLFKFDVATLAVDASLDKALQLDKEADAWNKVEDVYAARAALVTEATSAFNGLAGPTQALTDAHTEITTKLATVNSEKNTGAFDLALAAADALPGMVEAFKRKAYIFGQVKHARGLLIAALPADRNTYKELFDQIYPKALVQSMETYAAPDYEATLDDKTLGDIWDVWGQLSTVRARAVHAKAYFTGAETLTKASRDVLADEASRRALRYIAPDYRDRVANTLSQGKTAANRQDFEKAKLEVAAGQTFSDDQQKLIKRCLVYLGVLDKTNGQLEKVQEKYTSASAKSAAQACVMQVQEAENQALAKVFDAAERLLMSVQALLTDIAESEETTKSLGEAKQVAEREAGSPEMDKDIALIDTAIKSAEESSSKTAVAFEWGTLASAKMSLAAMRRANRDKDGKTLNQERLKALGDLSTLTDQLSAYRTSRALQTSLQAQIKTADGAFKTLPVSTLDVAKELTTDFNDIKAQVVTKVDTPLAAKTQPSFEEVLAAIATLQARLSTWQAAAKFFDPFSKAAEKAETVIKELETTSVPAVLNAFSTFDAIFKDELAKLPIDARVKALRLRKDTADKAVKVATLPKSASDMAALSAEAQAFKKDTTDLKAAIVLVKDKANKYATYTKDQTALMKQETEFKRLLKVLASAAQSGSASAIRVATNEIYRFTLMIQSLGASRTAFLNEHTLLDQRLIAAKSTLTSLPKAKLIEAAVTAVQDQQLAPATAELEQLKKNTEADAKVYLSAVVDIEKTKAKVASLEKAAAGFGSVAVAADGVEKQLTALAAFSHLPAFQGVTSTVEAQKQAAGQLLTAVPPDFVKAKETLEAATKLAATAILGAGKATPDEAPPTTSTGAPDFKESAKKLRTRLTGLKSTATTLKLDPKGLTPLETSITEIEKLSAEAA